MGGVRNSVKQKILKVLEAGRFPLNSFIVEFDDDDSNTFVTIYFRPNPTYFFRIEEYDYYEPQSPFEAVTIAQSLNYQSKSQRDISLSVVECPHAYKSQGRTRHREIESCITDIKTWIEEVHNELTAEAYLSETNTENVSDYFNLDDYQDLPPKDRFSHEEIVRLKKTLDEYETQIREKISESDEKSAKIEELNKVIEDLKAELSIYPKKTWLSIFQGRMTALFNKALSSDMTKELKKETAKEVVKSIFKLGFGG